MHLKLGRSDVSSVTDECEKDTLKVTLMCLSLKNECKTLYIFNNSPINAFMFQSLKGV